MSILMIIAIILFISALSDNAAAKDWELTQELEEERHQELMNLHRELHKDLKRDLHDIKKNQRKSFSAPNFTERKRYIKDKYGNILAEEILTSTDNDIDYDDYDDEDY